MLRGVVCEAPDIPYTQIDWEDCLSCALSWENKCELTYPILNAIYQDALEGHYFPSVSSLVYCHLRAWLLQRLETYEYPSSRIPLLVGTAMHKMLEDGAHDNHLIEVPLRITIGGVLLGGTADFYVKSTQSLYDWKTAKSIWKTGVPQLHHVRQVNMYAYMLARNELGERWMARNLFITYLSKSGKGQGHNGVLTVPVTRKGDAQIRKFMEKAIGRVTGEQFPDPYDPKPQKWECKICPVRKECEELLYEQGIHHPGD